MDEEPGVFTTLMPFAFACAVSMLSRPTPPRPMSLSPGQASIRSLRTLVALRTSNTSTPSWFTYVAS